MWVASEEEAVGVTVAESCGVAMAESCWGGVEFNPEASATAAAALACERDERRVVIFESVLLFVMKERKREESEKMD